MALINPCNLSATVRNTGSECNDALKASAMIIMVPRRAKWTEEDLEDFSAFLLGKIHAAPADRFFPIFGASAPINQITEANESDVLETLEDGSVQFIRYGKYNRTFITTAGGLCLAEALMGMNRNYSFIEVDITGQVAQMKNADGTYSGFPTNLAYAPAPMLANLKTAYKNQFMLSFDPVYYIQRGKIFASDASEDILALSGLIDTTVYEAAVHTNAGATAATGSVTITAVGSDGSTIDILVNGASISGGPVTKTSAESTVTLLATKIAAAITAATATNGGYTAVGSVGAVNLTGPAGLGATLNTVSATTAIVGSITNSAAVAFSGGVTGTSTLKLGIKTSCGETDLIALYGTDLVKVANFVVKNSAGTEITPTGVSIVSGQAHLVIPWVNDVYDVDLAAASVLRASDVEQYDNTTSAEVTLP